MGALRAVIPVLFVSALLAADEKPADNWQRMKECAAQAEKVAQRDNSDLQTAALIQSHYSPKYARCYMEEAVYGQIWGKSVDWRLLDAFEGKVLASDLIPPPPDMPHCSITDGSNQSTDCKVHSAYVEDHMNN